MEWTRQGEVIGVELLREQRSPAYEEHVPGRSVCRDGIRLEERFPLTATNRADTHIALHAPTTAYHGEQVMTSVRQELRFNHDEIALRPVRHDERLQHMFGRLNLKDPLKRQHHRIARA